MKAFAKKWQLDVLVLCVAGAHLGAYLAGCGALTIGPEEPPTQVECGAHAWGDKDGDGIGYRLPTTDVHVVNDSGYPLDLETLGMGVLRFVDTGFKVPMQRVNEPGSGWLGKAQVWIRNSTGIIDRALVLMNEGYPEMREPVIATHVGCMEVLHCAGLGHQVAADSCMDDCSKARNWGACMRDPARQTPNAHDQEQLALIYDMEVQPPDVCVQGEFTLLTFNFPAPGEGGDHGHE